VSQLQAQVQQQLLPVSAVLEGLPAQLVLLALPVEPQKLLQQQPLQLVPAVLKRQPLQLQLLVPAPLQGQPQLLLWLWQHLASADPQQQQQQGPPHKG
jgi:hypothetical protein